MSEVLSVRDLGVRIGGKQIVEGISFTVHDGQTVGIVGESGSGKSMTVLAATRLIDLPHLQLAGRSVLGGRDLLTADRQSLRRVHGREVGFVFQDPTTSLNPLLTLERQLTEGPRKHLALTRRAARRRALDLLEAVGIPDPEQKLDAYPHQLSGGQRQRVMIAVALACDPGLLIADEPTTALDVTTQAQIIDLVKRMQAERGMAVIWISHDLGVIGQVADEVTVLYRGAVVEHNHILDVFDRPRHDYTRRLLTARPSLDGPGPDPVPAGSPTVLEVEGLNVRYAMQTRAGKRWTHAVQDVSFGIRRGETLGLVGESGSGKSSVANALTALVEPESGVVRLDGNDVLGARGPERRELRRRLAMVFQDPYSALDPRTSVAEAITEPIRVHGLADGRAGRAGRMHELLDAVSLPRSFATRYPHELSGGQRQRVCIARALACEPEVMILDESTASLDVSIQSDVTTLLRELQAELGLAYLFIAHDLAVVHEMSHQVMVMHRGRVVEHRPSAELYASPGDDYTKTLLAAIPPLRPAASVP